MKLYNDKAQPVPRIKEFKKLRLPPLNSWLYQVSYKRNIQLKVRNDTECNWYNLKNELSTLLLVSEAYQRMGYIYCTILPGIYIDRENEYLLGHFSMK